MKILMKINEAKFNPGYPDRPPGLPNEAATVTLDLADGKGATLRVRVPHPLAAGWTLGSTVEISLAPEKTVPRAHGANVNPSQLDEQGLLLLPAFVRERLQLLPGEFVYFIDEADGKYSIMSQSTMNAALGTPDS